MQLRYNINNDLGDVPKSIDMNDSLIVLNEVSKKVALGLGYFLPLIVRDQDNSDKSYQVHH